MVIVQKCGSGKSVSEGNVGAEINAIEEMQWEYAYGNVFRRFNAPYKPSAESPQYWLANIARGLSLIAEL